MTTSKTISNKPIENSTIAKSDAVKRSEIISRSQPVTKSDVIAKNTIDPDGLDFATLRQEGIAFAQELSGNIWTDYNLHDPGVTILEALCFGLTELAYQSDVSVADYLADSHGNIDYGKFGLLKPHEVFPTGPVTTSDYCKLMLDAIPAIDRIEFIAEECGLYRVRIKLLEPLTGARFTDEQKLQIVQAVHEQYAQWRNLSEDLLEIEIVETTPCYLMGVIETDGKRPPAEVHAEIFFASSRKISSNVRLERYENVYASGMSLADIFEGPLTQHAYIAEAPSEQINTPKVLDELTGLVANIEGVKKVHNLRLVNVEGKPFSHEEIATASFYLSFPEIQQPQLNIYYNPGNSNAASGEKAQSQEQFQKHLNSAKRCLQKLEFEYRAFRSNKGNASQFYPLPEANKQLDKHYYSVQHHFPDIYGVNASGVPHWASQERKRAASQLKAYLYPFEQMMANFQQTLQHLSKMFQLNETVMQSYFSEFLDNGNIPDIESIYRYGAEAYNSNQPLATQSRAVKKVTRKYDNAIDRKSRALDSLIALYGEEFNQDGLLAFNYYHQDTPALWIIQNKIRYLKAIRELSARRSGALNVAKKSWNSTSADATNNLSCVHKKIALLLGLNLSESVSSLSDAFQRQKIRLVDDDALLVRHVFPASAVESSVPSLSPEHRQALKKWKPSRDKELTICQSMLTQGTLLDSYRLVDVRNEVRVYFLINDRSVALKRFDDRARAIDYVHKFIKMMIEVNESAENFFMVEHLLLRPRSEKSVASKNHRFNFQLTLVLPNWTARFSDVAFQQYAEKLICNHLPAHLFPHIYWATQEEMASFEKVYQPWMEALQQWENQRFNGTVASPETSDKGKSPEIEREKIGKQTIEKQARVLDGASLALQNWLGKHKASQDYWV